LTIQLVYHIACPKYHRRPFSSRSSAPFIASWLNRLGRITDRVSADQRLETLDDIIFVAKCSRVRHYQDRGPSYSEALLVSINSDMQGNR